MEPDDTCPECGGPLADEQDGLSYRVYCTRCDWAAVTTRFPPIYADQTRYEITLGAGDPGNADQLRAIARLAGVNFLGAREILQQPGRMLFAGPAREVIEKRDLLAAAGVSFAIQPDFPW